VVSAGDQVTSVAPGQRVVVPFQISRGTCALCWQGRTGNCASVPRFSMYGFGLGGYWGGAFAEQIAVFYADAILVPLPDGLAPVAATSVADNVCDGYRHVAPHPPGILQLDPGAEVLIIAGVTRRPVFSPSVPLYVGLAARALGATAVYFTDTRPEVRDHVARLGLLALHPAELRSLRPRRAGSSVTGCDCGFDVVEESLKYQVMKRLDPLTPDRLVLPGRAALERVANNCRVFARLQLEPVLAVQLIRPDHPERTRGTRAVELFPEHRPGVVQAVSLPPGSRSDLRRPDTVEVGDEGSDPLWRRRDNPFVAVPDLHPPLSSPFQAANAVLACVWDTSTPVDLRRTADPRGTVWHRGTIPIRAARRGRYWGCWRKRRTAVVSK